MKRYFLGVDIGATKSHALIADEMGTAKGFGSTGPGNHESVGYEGLKEALKICTSQAIQMAGIDKSQISSAGFGIAGYDWPGEYSQTKDAVASLKLHSHNEIVNDTIVGLAAGAEKGWGIGLVAGTGCNCWGWDENHNIGRVTGMGGWFGEYAGGGDIVNKAIVAVAYQAFKRGPSTELTTAFLELTGAKNALDLFEGLVLECYKIDSKSAPLVFKIAAQGDQVAQDILKWAGKELGEMANGVIRQVGLENRTFDLVMIGSVFDGGPLIIEPLRTTILTTAPHARFVRLQVPPVVGGVLIAMQALNVFNTQIRSRLLETTKILMDNLLSN